MERFKRFRQLLNLTFDQYLCGLRPQTLKHATRHPFLWSSSNFGLWDCVPHDVGVCDWGGDGRLTAILVRSIHRHITIVIWTPWERYLSLLCIPYSRGYDYQMLVSRLCVANFSRGFPSVPSFRRSWGQWGARRCYWLIVLRCHVVEFSSYRSWLKPDRLKILLLPQVASSYI